MVIVKTNLLAAGEMLIDFCIIPATQDPTHVYHWRGVSEGIKLVIELVMASTLLQGAFDLYGCYSTKFIVTHRVSGHNTHVHTIL